MGAAARGPGRIGAEHGDVRGLQPRDGDEAGIRFRSDGVGPARRSGKRRLPRLEVRDPRQLRLERDRRRIDLDPELGLARVVQVATAQDVGRAVNPREVRGQIDGGIAQGLGLALMEELSSVGGVVENASFADYLIPTAMEVPDWETGFTVTPSPHHPIGAKGIGESATVGSPPAIVNAVVDALAPYGVVHMDMPCTPGRVWAAMQGRATPPI